MSVGSSLPSIDAVVRSHAIGAVVADLVGVIDDETGFAADLLQVGILVVDIVQVVIGHAPLESAAPARRKIPAVAKYCFRNGGIEASVADSEDRCSRKVALNEIGADLIAASPGIAQGPGQIEALVHTEVSIVCHDRAVL